MSTHIPPLASYMHSTEYEAVNGIFPGMQDHNVPCAVCYTDTKTVKVMIPARISCLPHGPLSIKDILWLNSYFKKGMLSMSVLI